jgi:hypothetical protein
MFQRLKISYYFEVKNYSAGNACVVCGTQEGTKRNANGVYQQLISANGADLKIRADREFVGLVTNIKVRKINYTTELGDHLGGIGISGGEIGTGPMINISNLPPGILGNGSIHALVNPGFLDAAFLAYANTTTVKPDPASPGIVPQGPPKLTPRSLPQHCSLVAASWA